MRGNNSIELNQATMIEAVQEWFDKRWQEDKKVEVVSIKSSGGYAETFTIKLVEGDNSE